MSNGGQKEFAFAPVKVERKWSDIGFRVLIAAIIAAVTFAFLDGLVRGPIESGYIQIQSPATKAVLITLVTWISDFRTLAEQAFYAATIFFVGAKFFETRSLFTVGFDRMDAKKIELKGPDRENVVWVGYKCATKKEAETIAHAYEERIKAGGGG